MRPVITYWEGEDPGWTIQIAYDIKTATWYWNSVLGSAVPALIASGAAIDGRSTPFPQALKNDPRTVRANK